MAPAVEHDVLPDLVAQGDRIEADAEIGQEGEVFGTEDDRRRIERIVEQDDLGLPREGARQRRLRQPETRRLEGDEARHAAGPAHERQVGVVHRLEQHHFVAGRDEGQQGSRERLGGAGGDHHLALGIERQALPMAVMRRDRRAQLRQPHHGRILIPTLDHGVGRLAAHVLGTRIVGKALPEIDRAGLAGELGHHLEDGGRQIGEDRVHRRSRHSFAVTLARTSAASASIANGVDGPPQMVRLAGT